MSDDFDQFDKPLAVNRTLREIPDIQNPCIKWARGRGWWCKKFVSPANRSVMDYIIGKDCWVELVEFKAPGKKLTPAQAEEHEAARACGMRPVVFDNVEKFKQYVLQAEAKMSDVEYRFAAGPYDREQMAKGHEQGDDV
jgi:hypothetical protein